jgi:PLP dependent protein
MSLSAITSRMNAALARAGRPPGSVRLIAVSKLQPEARVRAVLDAGHRLFGENKVQEAEARWEALSSYGDVELHLVGPLQSNKVARAVQLFDAIHSVDRERIARRIADASRATGRRPLLFVQVNTGREPQKAGVAPEGLPRLLDLCREELDLDVAGLMCIPPVDEDCTPHFEQLRDLAARHGLCGLSMGMSDDFETAIALGATHVRVGSALFGARYDQR